MWRLCTTEHLRIANPNEVLHGMSLEQVLDAHEVVDMLEDLDAKAAQRARQK